MFKTKTIEIFKNLPCVPFFGDIMGKIKKPESELQKEKVLRELVAATDANYAVIEHRANCSRYNKEQWCNECIGGSLIDFTSKVLEELKYFDKCVNPQKINY